MMKYPIRVRGYAARPDVVESAPFDRTFNTSPALVSWLASETKGRAVIVIDTIEPDGK